MEHYASTAAKSLVLAKIQLSQRPGHGAAKLLNWHFLNFAGCTTPDR
jgi:hypothetical protein